MDYPQVTPVTPNTPNPVVGSTDSSPPYTYASFEDRLLATIVDAFFLFLIAMVVGIVLGVLSVASLGGMDATSNGSQWIGSLISMIYSVYFISKSGQTPGKKMRKIKVIAIDRPNAVPGLKTAFLREFVGKGILGLLTPVLLLGIVGMLWMIWDKKKQTWADKIAGTVVIKAV